MSWQAETYAVVPGSGIFQSHRTAWFMLDNGQAWGFDFKNRDLWTGGIEEGLAIYKLDPEYPVRVNPDDRGYPTNFPPVVGDFPDGSIITNALSSLNWPKNWVTDGTSVYFFDQNFFRIRRIDFDTMTVTSLTAGGTHPDPYNFQDSHNGLYAWPNVVMGDAYLDRESRYIYWWDGKRGMWSGSGYPPANGAGVGAYLRRISLDGTNPVETLNFVADVQHPSPLTLRNGRFWFHSRDHNQGESYTEGYFGISSVDTTGGDYKLHFIDPRPAVNTDFCAFRNLFGPSAIVQDRFITGNNAGIDFGPNRPSENYRFIAFDMEIFEQDLNQTIIHNPTDPIFETIANQQLAGLPPSGDSVYRDGVNSLIGGTANNTFARSQAPGWEDKLLIHHSVFLPGMAPSGFTTTLYRTLAPNEDIWDVTVLFTGEAFKGYDPIYPQTRTGPLEFELTFDCEDALACTEIVPCVEPDIYGSNVLGDPGVETQFGGGPGGYEIPWIIDSGTTLIENLYWSDNSIASPLSQYSQTNFSTQHIWRVSNVAPRDGQYHLRSYFDNSPTKTPQTVFVHNFRKCPPLGTEWQNFFTCLARPGDSLAGSVYVKVSDIGYPYRVSAQLLFRLCDLDGNELLEDITSSWTLIDTDWTLLELSGTVTSGDAKYATLEVNFGGQTTLSGSASTITVDLDKFLVSRL